MVRGTLSAGEDRGETSETSGAPATEFPDCAATDAGLSIAEAATIINTKAPVPKDDRLPIFIMPFRPFRLGRAPEPTFVALS